jgi:hypothetical protein
MEKAAPKKRNNKDSSGQLILLPGNNDLFILTRLFLSNDDSDNKFSRKPPKARTEITTN